MTSIFLYTREAHPAENWPWHQTFADKLRQARRASLQWQLERPMLVDDLEGTVHRAYGCLPNMAWVIDRRGRVAYRANWTDARTIGAAVEQLLWEDEQRAGGAQLTPFECEWAPSRLRDRPAFVRGLMAAGPSAREEFVAAAKAAGWPAAAIAELEPPDEG